MIKIIEKDPFKVESLRNSLAVKGEYLALIKTYNKTYAEIKNQNTPTLWNKLNKIYKVSKETNPIAFDRLMFFKSKLSNFIGKNILNIGSGSGELERFIFHDNANMKSWYGVDIAKKSVRMLGDKFPNSIFKVGNIRSLPFSKNFFDCVIVSEVMEHIVPSNTFEALSEVSRVLKKGGLFFVSVPLNENLIDLVNRNVNFNAHVRVYTPDLLKAELEISGFEIKNIELLYAFKKYYLVKKMVMKFLPNIRKPNNLIIVSKKI